MMLTEYYGDPDAVDESKKIERLLTSVARGGNAKALVEKFVGEARCYRCGAQISDQPAGETMCATCSKEYMASKKEGKRTVKETGEWNDDPDQIAWKHELQSILDDIAGDVPHFMVGDVRGFDNYQGPYGSVTIHGKIYKVWFAGDGGDRLYIEGYPVTNTSVDEIPGFLGSPSEIIDMLLSPTPAVEEEGADDDEEVVVEKKVTEMADNPLTVSRSTFRMISSADNDSRADDPLSGYVGNGDQFQARDSERIAAWKRDEWYYIGIQAAVDVEINGVSQTFISGGVWGIEDDSAPAHIQEMFSDECTALEELLKTIGFTIVD